MSVFACSNEGSLFAWSLEDSSESGFVGKLQIAFNVCTSSLKTLAISSSCKYLATGGFDERIYLYDTQSLKSIGELALHSDDITCLQFLRDDFLYSGSKDKSICIWSTNDWSCLKILSGSAFPIHDIAVHPSGKLCLSIDDKGMRLWNVITSKCTKQQDFDIPYDHVCWRKDGMSYLLHGGRSCRVFDIGNDESKFDIKTLSKINKGLFYAYTCSKSSHDWRIALALENGSISLYDMTGSEIAFVELKIATYGRLRDMDSCSFIRSSSSEEAAEDLVIATSKGKVLILRSDKLEEKDDKAIDGILEVSMEPRFTSVAVSNHILFGSKEQTEVIMSPNDKRRRIE